MQVVAIQRDSLSEFDLWRHASTYDAAEQPNRSRKDDAAKNPGDPGLVTKNCNWLSYDFQLPQSGWYELYITGSPLGWRRDIDLDGKRVFKGVLHDDGHLTDQKSPVKVRSLYIEQGKHTLKYTMATFPGLYLEGWGLHQSQTPAQQLHVQLQGNAIGRVADQRTLTLTHGPLAADQTFTLLGYEDISKQSFTLATVPLKATKQNATQTIQFKLPQQGSYTLTAQLGDATLTAADLAVPMLGAIDTTPVASHKSTVKKTLLWDIDCIKQTRNGQAISLDETFWEANGKTRLHTSSAGTYRESSDNLGDNPIVTAWGDKSLSSFAYAIDVPEIQVPYLLEVDYPDDTRRTTNVVILEKAISWPQHQYSQAQLGSGYETGDAYELSNHMQTHRVYFWPSVKEVRAALVSIHEGQRAAAARIRLYKLDEGLPDPVKPRENGRVFASYYEEWGRWGAHQRSSFLSDLNEMSRDIVGIDRWLRQSRAVGMNAIRPTAAVYRSCTYDSDMLYGYAGRSYDATRLAVLLAEKYRMRYSPELHITPLPALDNLVKAVADKPEDTLLYSQTGAVGVKNASGPGFNPLHPAVQQRYIDILGELADKLGDSPAFEGINIRLMTWSGNSWFWLSSLNWGYGDWTINQFQQDTGIKLPGDPTSLQRYHERYVYLTSDAMRDKWITWRNTRMLDYICRMRDRIRKANPHANLIFTGSSELDAIFEHDPNVSSRELLRDAGFDLQGISHQPGIIFCTSSGYGRAKSTSPVEDQVKLDHLLLDGKQILDGAAGRAYLFSNTYFEVHHRVPVDKLGLPGLTPRSYCGAAEASGRASLQKLAVVLAEQDTLGMAQGGLGYVWGQPEFYVPWLAEFTALPRVPFATVEHVGDAVVVRQKQLENKLYFYAVNREPYAVDVTIDLDATQVTRLGTQQPLATSQGKLTFQLDAFELASFQSELPSSVTQVSLQIPDSRITLLKNRLAACQTWLMQLHDGELKGALDPSQMKIFGQTLEQSWHAFAEKEYWQARVLLGSMPMLQVYETLGRYPQTQLGRDFPLQLKVRPTGKYVPANPPMFTATQLLEQAGSESKLQIVDSDSINPDWSGDQVLMAQDRLSLQFPIKMAGQYRIALGHVRPASGAMMVAINHSSLPVLAQTLTPNVPEQTAFGVVSLRPGMSTLSLQGTGQIGVYALNVEPVYHAISSASWQSLGPFPSAWYSSWQTNAQTAIHDAMVRIDPPMNPIDLSTTYQNAFGTKSGWTMTDHSYSMYAQWGVNFLSRVGITEGYICFAVTHITSPEDREAQLLIGSDWWTNAYLNGELVVSERDQKAKDDGAQFNGWKPTPALIKLRKGVNTLLVKHHGGSAATWFTAFITDPGDLHITAKKP
jgi:hypothetical protein